MRTSRPPPGRATVGVYCPRDNYIGRATRNVRDKFHERHDDFRFRRPYCDVYYRYYCILYDEVGAVNDVRSTNVRVLHTGRTGSSRSSSRVRLRMTSIRILPWYDTIGLPVVRIGVSMGLCMTGTGITCGLRNFTFLILIRINKCIFVTTFHITCESIFSV